jgi:hypothetical protein
MGMAKSTVIQPKKTRLEKVKEFFKKPVLQELIAATTVAIMADELYAASGGFDAAVARCVTWLPSQLQGFCGFAPFFQMLLVAVVAVLMLMGMLGIPAWIWDRLDSTAG